ncbi:hypothetical protein GCM10028805_55310 [Spirosoma harenae]
MNWNRTAFWGITYRQLVLVLGMYTLSALLYDGTIIISGRIWSKHGLMADFLGEMPRILLDYGLKLIIAAPVWYLLFVRLRHLSLLPRLGLHLVLLPLSILLWQTLYYAISDHFRIGRLRGDGQIWDTYISSLFYMVQFGVFHAYTYYRDLQQQRMLEAELRQLALQSELSALKAQLNPHFLYNVFNTISASVPPAQERTRELLAELADLFRYQLQASKTDLVLVRDEIAFVRKYLDLEKARFGDRLRIQFAIPDDVLDYLIPPMLLQPLVENSVRHGIAPLIEGGEVYIAIVRRESNLRVTIVDTGIGLTHSSNSGLGVGLANTRLRLAKTYGQELLIGDNHPQGVCVSFELPAIRKEPVLTHSEALLTPFEDLRRYAESDHH